MKKRLFASAAILLAMCVFTSCKKDTFTLSGTIMNGAGQSIWLEEITPDGPLFIDSIPVDTKGHFSFSYKMPYRSLYNLHTTDNNYIVVLPDYGEKIKVSGDYDNLSVTYSINGSPESILLWQLQQFSNDGNVTLTQLVDTTLYYQHLLNEGIIDIETVYDKKDETDSIYRQLFSEQQDYVGRFIEENRGSLSTLIALYKPFNNRLLIDTRDPNSIDWYDMVLEGLEERYPDNPHTLHFKNTVEHLRSALSRQ